MTWLILTLLVLSQSISGAYFWRILRRSPIGWTEAGGMGLALGTALAALAGNIGFLMPSGSLLRAWTWALPTLGALVVWSLFRARGKSLERLKKPDTAELVAVVVGLVAGLVALMGNLVNYPLTWALGWTGFHQDMIFFEALATGTSVFAPTDSIFMAGADFRYHWLSYAWAGQLAAASGSAPFEVLTRVLPAVALFGAVLISTAWTRQLTRQSWAPTVASLLVVSGGYVGAIYGTVLNFDSPSQSLTSVWLLGLCVALLGALKGGSRWGWVLAVLVLVLSVSGGKFSSIFVAAGGFGLVTLVGVVTGATWWRRAVLLSLVALVAISVTYVLMISGSAQAGGLGLWTLLDRASSVQGLNPQTTDRGVILGTALLILAIGARWAGVVWLVADRRTRWLPETQLGIGMGVVGLLAIVLFSGGFNDTWFALAASAPLSVLSAVGAGNSVGALAGQKRVGEASSFVRPAAVAVTLGALAAVPVAMVWGTGSYAVGGWRWAAPVVALALAVFAAVLSSYLSGRGLAGCRRFVALFVLASVAMSVLSRPVYLVVDHLMAPATSSHDMRTFAPVGQFVNSVDQQQLLEISESEMSAGEWLRANASVTDVIATNVTYSPLVPALTRLRTLISGIHYQAPYGRPDQIEILLTREAESIKFISNPDVKSYEALCKSGVEWVWVDPRRVATRSWAPWAESIVVESDVIILRMASWPCE